MVKSEKKLFFQYRRADGLIAAFIQVINQRYIGVISTPYFYRDDISKKICYHQT